MRWLYLAFTAGLVCEKGTECGRAQAQLIEQHSQLIEPAKANLSSGERQLNVALYASPIETAR